MPKKLTKSEKRKQALIAKYGSYEEYLRQWRAKREQTIIDRYGSVRAFRKQWRDKRRSTIIAKLGEDGYKKYLSEAGTKGGQKSKRGKAKKKSDS